MANTTLHVALHDAHNVTYFDPETLILFGGHFPWNLRPIRHFMERGCFVFSIVVNMILTSLLLTEKNEVMKPYSRVLLLNQAIDYVYTCTNMWAEVELEMNEGCYILVLNGVPMHWSSPAAQLRAVHFWLGTCAASCIVCPAEFIFRYFLVVKKHAMTTLQVLGMGALIITNASWDGLMTYLSMAFEPNHNATFGHLMQDPMWRYDGHPTPFFSAKFTNFFMQAFMLSAGLQISFSMFVVVWSTMATLRTLSKDRDMMSKKVRKMQTQLNRLMFAEAVSTFCTFCIPMSFVILFLYMKVKFIGWGVAMSMALSWMPAAKPLTTILLVGPYRRKLFGKLVRSKKVGSTSAGELSSVGDHRRSSQIPVSVPNISGTTTISAMP
ncbi:CBN-SRJ-11 protein [Aphelenchoides avenae]|nr:CBN-SRJ-11 protein [Aphelenchus avenae]